MNHTLSVLLIRALYLAVYASLACVFCRHALQMFQQNRYELYRYSKWLFDKKNLHFSSVIIYLVIVFCLCRFLKKYGTLFSIFVSIAYAIYLLWKERGKTYIKDLVLTARVKRQIIVLIVLLLGFLYALMQFADADILGLAAIFMPYLLIYPLAVLTAPIENRIKKHYENDARRILADLNDLIRIGITGSYGKTSTKNIIGDIISDRFYTLITPASYNTPMGITRTVREMLKPIHQVFVCEMGADKKGDISYLMDMVKPKYGVVTSIGPQHLNTFHDIDTIIREKMQEIEMLPLDGVGFINLDNPYIAAYPIRNRCRVVTVGTEDTPADYVAQDIVYTKEGSRFSVRIDGKKRRFATCLLGKHNITNILIGIAIARELGMSLEEIVSGVRNVKQVEHRLEVKKINGLTFIDDAFNSNPTGSRMALDVLAMMNGTRVIVTPGMIDLGDQQDPINREFGRYMADKTDHVILVGEKQTAAIREGLAQMAYDPEKITVCKNINDAFAYVYSHFTARDTILLENDLPDAFSK